MNATQIRVILKTKSAKRCRDNGKRLRSTWKCHIIYISYIHNIFIALAPVDVVRKDLLMQPICFGGIEFVNGNLTPPSSSLFPQFANITLCFIEKLSRTIFIFDLPKHLKRENLCTRWENFHSKNPLLPSISIFICLLFPDTVYLPIGFM